MAAHTHQQPAPSAVMGANTNLTRPKRSIILGSELIFWLLTVALFVLIAMQVGAAVQTALLITAAVGLGAVGLLLARRAWSRPILSITHLCLAVILSLLAWQLADQLAATQAWLSPLIVQATLAAVTVVSVGLFVLLESRVGKAAFALGATSPLAALCPTCGATLNEDAQCNYCDVAREEHYFLQPVLKNARRIPLTFEPGHERIRIGRTVGNGEAWIDTNENKRYRTISRHHADIERKPETDKMLLHKGFTNQEVLVDGEPVLLNAEVSLGSLIQLGKVQFILGNDEYEPALAYFVDQADETERFLLRFNGLDNEQTIGRGPLNDVVLPNRTDVSKVHAAIIFDAETALFFVRNASSKQPVYVDGHVLESGRTTELSADELTIIQLGSHNFNFLPVLYQPTSQERVHV